MITIEIPLEIPSQNAGQGRNWRARAAKIKGVRLLWHRWCRFLWHGDKASGARALHVIAYRTQRCRDDSPHHKFHGHSMHRFYITDIHKDLYDTIDHHPRRR